MEGRGGITQTLGGKRGGGHEWGAWNAPGAGDCGIAEVCQDFGRPPEQMAARRSHSIYSLLFVGNPRNPACLFFVPPPLVRRH